MRMRIIYNVKHCYVICLKRTDKFLTSMTTSALETKAIIWSTHCVKSVRIRSYSGPHFPAFELNTETEYGGIYAVTIKENLLSYLS